MNYHPVRCDSGNYVIQNVKKNHTLCDVRFVDDGLAPHIRKRVLEKLTRIIIDEKIGIENSAMSLGELINQLEAFRERLGSDAPIFVTTASFYEVVLSEQEYARVFGVKDAPTLTRLGCQIRCSN